MTTKFDEDSSYIVIGSGGSNQISINLKQFKTVSYQRLKVKYRKEFHRMNHIQ